MVPGRKFSQTTSDVGGQPTEQFLSLGLAQVEGDPLATPTLDGPPHRVVLAVGAGGERPDGPHEVATLGVLDLDDLGAHLAEQPGAERRADAGAHVDDPQAGEGRLVRRPSPVTPSLNGLPGSQVGRRSLKAAMPSAISGEVVAMAWAWPSRSSEAASDVSKLVLRRTFDSPSDRVGPAASRAASSSAAAVELVAGGEAAVGQAEVDRLGARSLPRPA